MNSEACMCQGYPYEKCIHGKCVDHMPEWENVGEERREPNPGIFGKKTYWTIRHCGKPMARYKVVQTRRCKKCGVEEDHVVKESLVLCLCCGYRFSLDDSDSYDGLE